MLALVLGGGGSRGALQAGAIERLFKAGIRPDMYIGSSIGAINAAFLAANPTYEGAQELIKTWLSLREGDFGPSSFSTAVWNLLRGRDACFQNSSWQAMIRSRLPGRHFSSLKRPCYTVTADINSGEMVVFGDRPDDSLFDGIMASTAAYPLFPTWQVKNRHYIDGGYVAMLPVRQAIERGATEIIALDITNPLVKLSKTASRLQRLNRCAELLMNRLHQNDMEWTRSQPGVRMKIVKLQCPDAIWFIDFTRTMELVALGRAIARRSLEEGEWWQELVERQGDDGQWTNDDSDSYEPDLLPMCQPQLL
jgi:NTE family protein